jgi:predicted RNA-binding protein with TRAM domain
MGRPLKIQKTSTGSGNGGAAVSVDLAFPNFGSLTAPVFNAPTQTLDNAQYLGVVGGAAPTDTPSATNPRVDVTVNIAAPSGSGIGVAQGYIIRQKGSHKYLVGDVTGVNDGSFVVGQAYQISTLGTNTDWPAAGAPANYGLGTVFTATSVGGSGNGAANSVGVCVLADDVTPAAGLMAITFTFGDSTATKGK